MKDGIIRSRKYIAYKLLCAGVLAALLCLCLPLAAMAEGSSDLCENGGYRPYTERYALETAGEDRDQIVSVYLQQGETVSFGSSVCNAVLGYTNEKLGTNFTDAQLAALNATDILVTTPEWNSTANPHSYPYIGGVKDDAVLLYNTDDNATETTQGYIANPAREAAGPTMAAGYTPYVLTAKTGGIYRFKFYSAKHNIENPKLVKTDAAWNQKGACVAAWDTTVRSASGTVIEGRTFTDTLFLNMGNNVNTGDALKACIFAVTDDGYLYKVDFNGMDPYGFVFYANNRGMLRADDDTYRSLYHSVMSNNNQLSDLPTHDITLNNIPSVAGVDHTYRLFFNEPDPAALTALGIGDPDVHGTGITNFKFAGKGDAPPNEGYIGLGGTFSFDAGNNVGATSYQIELNFGTDNIVVLSNDLKAGANSITWDGRDAKGAIVTPGEYGSGEISLKLKGGEVHFPLMDVENNRNGIIITRLNGMDPDSVVYYNNSGSKNIGDTTAPWTADKNWNVVDKIDAGTTGVDSASGAMAYKDHAGDQCALDVWAYYSTPADIGEFKLKIVGTQFIATKKWENEPEGWAHRPESVTLQLYANGIATGEPVTVTATESWSHTFTGLPPADANGSAINYSVKESPVPMYYKATYGTVAGTVTDGYTQTVANTFTRTSVKVRKVWDNEDDQNPPSSLAVQLLADGAQVDTCTLTAADNNWEHTFTDLDPSKTYTVTETEMAWYTGKTAVRGNAETGYTCTLTNVFNSSLLTTVGVMKEWQNVPEGLRPDAVTMALLRSPDNGTTWEPAKTAGGEVIDPVALNDGNGWMQVWRQLPNGDGVNNYTYAVAETLGDNLRPEDVGYTLTDSEDQPIADSAHIPLRKLGTTGYYYVDVVNTYKPASMAFTKTWQHGINTVAPPESITVQLQQRTPGADFADYGPAVTLTAATEWKYTWTDLPSFNKDNAAFAYRVTEKALSTYRIETGAVAGTAKDGYTQQITNSYKYTMLAVTKGWDHGVQPEDDYPSGVRCKLVSPDGTAVRTFMLTEANGWRNELHDLPCYDAIGNAIDYTAYTVAEGDVIDYEHSGGSVSGNAAAGYTAALANTYAPAPTPTPAATPTATPAPSAAPTPAAAPEGGHGRDDSDADADAAPTPTVAPVRTIPATGEDDAAALCMAAAAVSGIALAFLTAKCRRKKH